MAHLSRGRQAEQPEIDRFEHIRKLLSRHLFVSRDRCHLGTHTHAISGFAADCARHETTPTLDAAMLHIEEARVLRRAVESAC